VTGGSAIPHSFHPRHECFGHNVLQSRGVVASPSSGCLGYHASCVHVRQYVIFFMSPAANDLEMASNIFKIFEGTSGLTYNMNKCQIASIRCETRHLELAALYFPCSVVEFLLRYLGILLSITTLPRVAWQRLIDDMADRLLAWKGSLMHKSGCLT
jgi:hypothetical protein